MESVPAEAQEDAKQHVHVLLQRKTSSDRLRLFPNASQSFPFFVPTPLRTSDRAGIWKRDSGVSVWQRRASIMERRSGPACTICRPPKHFPPLPPLPIPPPASESCLTDANRGHSHHSCHRISGSHLGPTTTASYLAIRPHKSIKSKLCLGHRGDCSNRLSLLQTGGF